MCCVNTERLHLLLPNVHAFRMIFLQDTLAVRTPFAGLDGRRPVDPHALDMTSAGVSIALRRISELERGCVGVCERSLCKLVYLSFYLLCEYISIVLTRSSHSLRLDRRSLWKDGYRLDITLSPKPSPCLRSSPDILHYSCCLYCSPVKSS